MKPFDFKAFRRKYGIALRDEPAGEDKDPALRATSERMYHAAQEHPETAVKELEKLVKTYPGRKDFWNYLYVVYRKTDRPTRALKTLRLTLKRFPDYLFAAVNYVQFEQKESWILEHADLLGPNLDIHDWPAADNGTYHLSEFYSFETAAITVLLFRNELEAARTRLDRLHELGYTEQDLERLTSLYQLRVFEPLLQLAESRARTQHPRVRPKAVDKTVLSREPVHQVISETFSYELEEITQQHLDRLLALPRAELVADLRLMLRQSLAVYLLKEHGKPVYDLELEHEVQYLTAVHSLFLIGHLKATEALPEVLDFVRGDEQMLEYFFGDFSNYYYTPVLRILTQDSPEILGDYLMEPHRANYDRLTVLELLTEIGSSSPERREQVINILRRHLEAALSGRMGKDVFDTDLLSNMVYDAALLRATELLPLARQIDARGWIDPRWAGTLEEFESEFHLPPDPPVESPPRTAMGLYRNVVDLGKRLDASYPDPAHSDLTPSFTTGTIVRETRKVGRNEPCPCGSGKKYKKCCWRS